MPISLNSGLINPKDFTEWQMVMGKIVPNRELVPGHWLLNWTTSKQRKSGVGGALYLDLMSPSLSILEFGEWLLFKIYYQGERNPKSAGTQNLSYKERKKKSTIPPKFSQCNFLMIRWKLRKHPLSPTDLSLAPTQNETLSSKGSGFPVEGPGDPKASESILG